MPRVSCNPATDLLLIGQCHYAPGAIAASACCDPQPAGCSQSDCTCLLHNGNFLDYQLAAEEGIDFPEYRGPKRICSYRFSCTPATDGGLATISCTPA